LKNRHIIASDEDCQRIFIGDGPNKNPLCKRGVVAGGLRSVPVHCNLKLTVELYGDTHHKAYVLFGVLVLTGIEDYRKSAAIMLRNRAHCKSPLQTPLMTQQTKVIIFLGITPPMDVQSPEP
jgi:hypothetical protein